VIPPLPLHSLPPSVYFCRNLVVELLLLNCNVLYCTSRNGFSIVLLQHFDVGDRKAILRSPLVKKIMDTDGVKSVFLGRDFLTITKKNEETWRILKTLLFSTILDHVASGEPCVLDQEVVSDTEILDTDSEVVAMIKELLEEKIRPSVQDDGGDILFEGFDENTGIVEKHFRLWCAVPYVCLLLT
jgi:hypothetical protein